MSNEPNPERDENAMSARAKSRIGRGEAAWPGEAGIESRIRPSGASGEDGGTPWARCDFARALIASVVGLPVLAPAGSSLLIALLLCSSA